jgi:hypothetical protein
MISARRSRGKLRFQEVEVDSMIDRKTHGNVHW